MIRQLSIREGEILSLRRSLLKSTVGLLTSMPSSTTQGANAQPLFPLANGGTPWGWTGRHRWLVDEDGNPHRQAPFSPRTLPKKPNSLCIRNFFILKASSHCSTPIVILHLSLTVAQWEDWSGFLYNGYFLCLLVDLLPISTNVHGVFLLAENGSSHLPAIPDYPQHLQTIRKRKNQWTSEQDKE